MRHVKLWFQKLAPSSRLNNTPPIGAPKAAATPAAAPALTKSRFSLKFFFFFSEKVNHLKSYIGIEKIKLNRSFRNCSKI